MGLLTRLRRVFRRTPAALRVEQLTEPAGTGEPWDRWLAAGEGRRIEVVHVMELSEHDAQIEQRTGQIDQHNAVLVRDGLHYSFARPWPNKPGRILASFGTIADVVERTTHYDPSESS